MRKLILPCFCSFLLIQSCSFLDNQPIPPSEGGTPAIEASKSSKSNNSKQAAKPTYSNFETETLYSLIVAEVAASRQQYDITLNNYIDEAKETGDLGVIARATRLAQYFRAHEQTLAMGKLWLAQTPDDIEANAIVATAHIEKRQFFQALDYAEIILSLIDVNDSNGYKSAGITETIANFSRSADTLTRQKLIGRYTSLSERYPDFTAIKVGLSILYEAQPDTAAAYKVIEEALANDSDYLPAIMQEIRLLQESKQNELAIKKLKTQLDKKPDDARLRLLYARMLTQTDIEAAYEEFTRLSEQSPQHLDIKFSRALIALELKKKEEAERLLKELLKVNYRKNTINYYLGNIAELDKNYDRALGHYIAVTSGDDYIPAHSRAARIMANQGNVSEAQKHFSKLRTESPNRRSQLYAAEAEMLEQQDDIESALDILSVGIDEYPDNINLRYTRSSLYEKTDQLVLMENDLRHILNLEPENSATLNALGYFLTSRTDRHAEAFQLIQKALASKPDDPAIMDSMGWVLFNLKRYDEAIEYLRKAFELFPDPEVAAHLGEALWTQGNKQEARSIWINNLKDNPNDNRIIDTMERLRVNPY